MQIVVIGKKSIYHDKLGRLRPGWSGELADKIALRYIAAGAAERVETKEAREVPFPVAGGAVPLCASPAAPALPPQTASESVSGEKPKRQKRGRLSLSTPRSA